MFSSNLALLNEQNLATLSSTGSEHVAQISFFFGLFTSFVTGAIFSVGIDATTGVGSGGGVARIVASRLETYPDEISGSPNLVAQLNAIGLCWATMARAKFSSVSAPISFAMVKGLLSPSVARSIIDLN